MKRSMWVAAAGFLALSTFSAPMSRAADHRDWPNYMTDITSDITDLYTWMSADGSKVYFVLDIQGANTGAVATTQFSNAVQYVIHVNSGTAYGTAMTSPDTIICTFNSAATQQFQCWGPSVGSQAVEYVTDTVGNTAGKASTSGNMTVYAGYRNDPFYFNIRGFLEVATTVNGAAAGLAFNAAGCPTINAATSTALVGQLSSNGGGTAATGVDDFGPMGNSLLPPAGGMTNGNVLSIVISMNKSLLTKGGNIISTWASTNM